MMYSKEKLGKLTNRWLTPKGKNLIKAIKEFRCYLSPGLFKKTVKNFPGTTDKEVLNSIDLRGAPLAGFDFRVSVQEDDEGFSEDLAIISNIHFEGANLKHCNFENGKIHNCHFENSEIIHSEFKNSTINNCDFSEADCTGLNLHGTKIINCTFNNADIKDVILDSTIVDQKTGFGKTLKSEQERNFHFASIEYKQLKEMYKNSSLHNIADRYHYKEMVAKRKINKKTSPSRWLNYFFGDLLCKYGTSYIRVFLWSAAVMTICAFIIYSHESLLYHNQATVASFWDALYFSIVSFTTLGYGDFHATGAIRFLAATEAYIGATLMALFTVIVGRNIIRD